MTENLSISPGRYQHYKGKLYEVVGLARHSESLEPLVVYRASYESDFGKDALWARPYQMFIETVVHDGKTVPRFKKIDCTPKMQ